MTTREGSQGEGASAATAMELRHLRRETRTALELAVVTLAPHKLTDRLAMSSGLLEALAELPVDSAPAAALVPRLITRTKEALGEWQAWHAEHLANKMPQG
ncbi:MAG: hypothetical protein JWN48_1781 [Myxococcaceae bacterium]|nr:hypothetical protein [Myxococcaceae bacterium]